MELRYSKQLPYIPDPARSRPLVTAAHRTAAAATPPAVVPFHCKPWLDGQTIGYTLFYGYASPITIHGQADGTVQIDGLELLQRETGNSLVVDQFSAGYFTIVPGYGLETDHGWVSLLLPATRPPAGLSALTGVLETDWYPRDLFLVYTAPPAGVAVALRHGDELARVVVVPRADRAALRPMTAAEHADRVTRRAAYRADELRHPRWHAATGKQFTHTYKDWAHTHRAGVPLPLAPAPDDPPPDSDTGSAHGAG